MITTETRGVRNRNPGNIDYNPANQWQGQLKPDPAIEKRFARFDTAENGIRALGKLLINYRGKDGMPGVGGKGIDTPREFVSRWAPGNENNTEAYIAAIAKRLGVQPNDVIDIKNPATLRSVMLGIIVHENGRNPYPDAVFEEGLRRALL
ncbi:structural protein P5 [Pseudomonas sp. FW306-02-F02-AA]|uniref:Structural protein P5 n=1 Tax=Pseudomonas fluorescens TaxID=294 RepID=A0A0N9WPL5_PSEFL|nr:MULTISPECIES: structural protein P5 [Pseudomonas]ALI04367.1 structural protein P5 [Pseudomonas fluorescens]PMZ01617.1 structural protein P5 [Pseudomonas sp. FW306-02-F02-AB]PMZ10172.1 structural protein P5 [Pseudomonas sp. FW306-02-H06C]PMZ13231.1 structural protein P5 [Pseudomonas sp. FW306-02-F02-AA]PMZ19274.1 structural protein P5 [Pseudomonas sp. FW306-02-F08-AA]